MKKVNVDMFDGVVSTTGRLKGETLVTVKGWYPPLAIQEEILEAGVSNIFEEEVEIDLEVLYQKEDGSVLSLFPYRKEVV